MKKQGQSEGVKGKVISGFFLLLVLALVAILAVIQLASQLSPPDSGVSQSVIKLTLVSNMLSELIEANGQARAYINTGEKRYLIKYRKLDKGIQQLADSLKYFSTLQPEQYKRMLSIDSLLRIKRGTMENFFRVRRADDTLAMKLENKNMLANGNRDTASLSKYPVIRPGSDRQLSQEENNEESNPGFFKKIWDNFTGKRSKKDSLQKPSPQFIPLKDTLALAASTDTTIEMIKSQLQQMGEQERIYRQRIIDRDLLLLRTDQVIMDEIRNVFLLFEKEEINRAIEESGHGREVFRRLWYTAIVLAAVGLITMIVFVILIWKDLARSNFYRRQLESARHLAEKLLKVKELFLANMSHEIRTPITSIIGFTERLETTKLTKEQKNYLRYINSSSEHLLGLVDDLLDYSRIESGKFNLEMTAFIPADLFLQSFETLRHRAENKGLEMIYTTTLEPGIAVLGDPLRIRQIVFNLLNNSIKFTEKGFVKLTTSAVVSNGHMKLNFIVSDSGIGIPEEKQQEIFGEFTQVDVGITRKYGGSGLGLAICQKLTNLMKGEIALSSSLEKGTTISVTLPLAVYEGKVAVIPGENRLATINLTGFRILMAEDDETTRILLTESLRSAGASVDVAEDGSKAWELFNENKSGYDLVMTDIQMPNLSGPELAERISKSEETSGTGHPPILGLTAHATNEELEQFRQMGISSILIKPFRHYQLVAALAKVLKIYIINHSESINEEENTDRAINLEAFAKFSGDDPEAFIRILTSLADNMQSSLVDMHKAFESSDYQNLALLSHRMLPNIRNLGAQEEAILLQSLETLRTSKTFDHDAIDNQLNTLKNGITKIVSALRKEIDRY
ncbi:MAG: response regulator [Bacteroidales bacterium]|nr:response regulator [Bacteroidales bacterium]